MGSSSGRPSEAQLLRRIHERDTAALEELYDRYSRYVMGVAVSILGDPADAEEVVQDVFWRLWTRGLHYDPERGRFTTWLFAVARNRALDGLRRKRRRPSPDLPALELALEQTAELDPEEDSSLAQDRALVRRMLRALPEPQRQVIELAFFCGLTHSEVAGQLGEPLGTVKSRIRRAMAQLRSALLGSREVET